MRAERHPVSTFRFFLALAFAALAGGCAGTDPLPGVATRPIELADGIFMFRGSSGEVDRVNLGRTGNAGFIVGDNGVIAVDTGTSYRHGAELLAAIARVTDKPVRLVLITHTRQDFLFGASAYRERGIPIHMHRRASGLMTSRCENCLRALKRQLGDAEMQGTTMFRPDHEFEAGHRIDLAGRPVRILHFGHSSGPGDIAVFDEKTQTLFAGGLLDNERIPDVQDSDLAGWKAALRQLRGLDVQRIVPGHGPVATPALIDTVERYLNGLEARMQELLAAGTALSEIPDASVLPDFQAWDQYETIHRRNASIVFLRLERETIFRQ
jgi:glyoxylase-like metal-dependent hydrolase (beta-lactamase superfamily II)